MKFSNNSYEYGPVYVTKGPHEGRVGYLDDTVAKGRTTHGIVYFGLMGITAQHSQIPLSYLRHINTSDLLSRHEELWRRLTPYSKNPLQGSERVESLEEIALVLGQLGNRMFDAQFHNRHDGARIFLSHASADKVFVRGLAVDLTALGYRPWLDEWEILGGESIPSRISEGLEEADFVLVVLSKSSTASLWVESEWQAKYWKEISERQVFIVPLLLDDCSIPTLLAPKKYIDFRGDYSEAIEALAKSLAGHARKRKAKAEPRTA
jgi:TIR domain